MSLILHAHLPHVADTSCEVWFHEAMLGSYIPITRVLDEATGPGRITLSVSPPLLDMLTNEALLSRFEQYLAAHAGLAQRLSESGANATRNAAATVAGRASESAAYFDAIGKNLPEKWRQLRDAGRIELGTCAGTHAILPLLHTDDFRRMHIEHACERFNAMFGGTPRFMWLPECGFATGTEELLAESGVWATVVEARAFGEASPAPVRGNYAPVVTGNVAVFARDPKSSALVWSRDTGYPGDSAYREFHRDAAWDLPLADVPEFVRDGERQPSAVKLWSVSGPDVELGEKKPWDADVASHRVAEHVEDFVSRVAADIAMAESLVEGPVHLCSPFDAELFGHWWYEGPDFLRGLLEAAPAAGIDLITPSDYLAAGPALQLGEPATSTWGAGGDFSWWVDDATTWIIPLLHTAEDRWLDARRRDGLTETLQEAAWHLMQAQASDWPFAIRGVRHAEFAKRQIADHVIAFDRLLKR